MLHEQGKPTPPVVLMPMGAQERLGHNYQVMTVKYMRPLVEHGRCVPLLAPTCFGLDMVEAYLDQVDGVYLTGAGTNLNPALYGEANLTPHKAQDPERDAFDIAVTRSALRRGLPFLGICRGLQELNVALGGSLHQQLYNMPGLLEHRENSEASVEDQYGPSHSVRLVPGTWLAQLLQTEELNVNSLHGQGLNRLGRGLEPLAHAPDGLVEAAHVPGVEQFTLAVQWHPEWRAASNPASVRIFEAFGQACHAFHLERCAAAAAVYA